LSHGFLTIEFTSEQLHKINSELGICVAIQGEKVVGYLMAESIAFAVGSPLIAHLLNRLKEIVFDDVPLSTRRLFVYGPVCIDREHRCLRSGTGEKIEIDWQVGNSWLVWSKCSSRQKRIPWVLSL
jgi:hypothetical protein